jgi:integrase
MALLDAAGGMDREANSNGKIPRRALLATLIYAGLRISEALELRWRDVDLAGGRLRVRESKTDAGIAYVDLLPPLREELTTLKMSAADTERGTLLFPSAVGTRQDRNRVRTRVLAPAIERADELLDAEGLARLPEGLTLHALRRTFASLLAILPGYDTPYIISQVRHTDPGVTYGFYAKQIRPEHRERLIELVLGADDLAVAGSESETGGRDEPAVEAMAAPETAD